ncbi:MAG: 3-hydroxybutyryl-CoA dehydrogenase [Planctomycetes bacterium]|nr:3-hydroxybutyryl-CoA dehydrogenase [Planctomycetota bacterium]
MSSKTVGVIGAGTMGAGIAQVAAMAGWTVELMDVDEATVHAAIAGINKRLDRLVEKERSTQDQRDVAAKNLLVANSPDCFSNCELIIEVVVEDLDIKAKVLGNIIPALNSDCIIATNTSSLSVTKIGEAIGQSHRTVGMHFFNPAPIMKLVEVIKGDKTDIAIADRVAKIAESWGKKVARAADVPGFIVNHVARPYYLEAFRILEDGYATPEQIDNAMKQLGGFRMGPLELTDLIGQDINTATSRSVWEQLDRPPLLTPSSLQEQLVADGYLGKKTGRGVYDYSGDSPCAAIDIDLIPLGLNEQQREAASGFVRAATDETGDELQQYVFARILSALFTQAQHAYDRGVAEKQDIDTALKFGVNYPKGPFEWAQQIGKSYSPSLPGRGLGGG